MRTRRHHDQILALLLWFVDDLDGVVLFGWVHALGRLILVLPGVVDELDAGIAHQLRALDKLGQLVRQAA